MGYTGYARVSHSKQWCYYNVDCSGAGVQMVRVVGECASPVTTRGEQLTAGRK